METRYACPRHLPIPPRSPSPSPSPTNYTSGYNACNSIKIKSLPSTFSSNLINGSPYNSSCLDDPSQYSQFFYYIPASNGIINATTCGLTSMDTMINVYSSLIVENWEDVLKQMMMVVLIR